MILNLVHYTGHGHVLSQVLLHQLVAWMMIGSLIWSMWSRTQHSWSFVEQSWQSGHVTQQRVEWKHSKGGRNQARAFARTGIVDIREGIHVVRRM